ncbi:MAG TPA: TonB-dependent receptor [Usitatibacter sp.]|nr:TonB-dependent receptor [Usitatibacter sp.]
MPGALLQALGAGVALSVIAAGAQAQQAQRVEKIEVTGSHVKRVDTETVSPVDVITREQIERTGQATVAEVLRNIPANTGGSFSESFTNSFAPGAAGISLRGLGQKTTLVLLNGRRITGFGFAQNLQDTFVDLNAIPASAIERVEILKDGASAIYGSDAIAGVVNIILRRDFKGLEISGQAGRFEGKHDWRATLTGGWGDLARDRWSVFGTLDFYKRDLVMMRDTKFGADRDFRDVPGGRNNQSLQGGGTWRQLTSTNANTNNFRAISECETFGGRTVTAAQAVDLGLIAGPLNNTNFNQPGNTFCLHDFDDQFTALPKTDRTNFIGRAQREFSPNLTGYFELGLSRVDTFQRFQSPFFSATTGLAQTSAGLRPFTYNIRFAPGVAGNPFPSNALYNASVFNDMGTRDLDIRSDTARVLAGATYTIRNWDLDSAINWSRNEVDQQNINRITLAGTSAVFGVPTTPQPPVPVSTNSAYNLDRPSLNTDAVRNQMLISFPRKSTSELKSIDTKASTELMQMAAGPLGLALGVEGREEKLNDRPDPLAEAGQILGQGITSTNGSRRQYAGYAELAIPITRAIEAQVAGRYDHYSDYGSSSTPKIGIKFRPTNTLLLRANWGKGFRAPTLPEISPSVATFFTSVIDPTTNQITQISGVFAGNPGLQAEKSDSWTAGLVFEPNANFNVGVNFYNIDWKNIVAAPSFQAIVNSGDPTRVIRDPSTGNIVTVLNGYINVNETKTQGVDLEGRYRISSPYGRWTLRANAVYVDKFEENGTEVAGTNGGTNTIPRFRSQLSVDWDYRALSATLTQNYIHRYLQQLLPGSFFTPQDPRFQNQTYPERVPSYTTYDLYAKYQLTKNVTVSGAVLNLYDKTPYYDPGFSGTFLYDFSLFDVRGRQFRLGVSFKM